MDIISATVRCSKLELYFTQMTAGGCSFNFFEIQSHYFQVYESIIIIIIYTPPSGSGFHQIGLLIFVSSVAMRPVQTPECLDNFRVTLYYIIVCIMQCMMCIHTPFTYKSLSNS